MNISIEDASALPPSSPEILVAVGDIHGRLDLLEKLLKKLDRRLKDRAYKLIFLGDYVDRGPDSR
ncbi:MAG: metallophosphoesterase, partial [Pseudomonadota bacterium]